jgi:hypothetical protein
MRQRGPRIVGATVDSPFLRIPGLGLVPQRAFPWRSIAAPAYDTVVRSTGVLAISPYHSPTSPQRNQTTSALILLHHLIPSFPFPSIEIEKLNLKRPSAVRTARRSVDQQGRLNPGTAPLGIRSPQKSEIKKKKKDRAITRPFPREGQRQNPRKSKAKEPWLLLTPRLYPLRLVPFVEWGFPTNDSVLV